MTKTEAFMAALRRLLRLVAAGVIGVLAANMPGIEDLFKVIVPDALYLYAGPIFGLILNVVFKFLRGVFPEAAMAKVL